MISQDRFWHAYSTSVDALVDHISLKLEMRYFCYMMSYFLVLISLLRFILPQISKNSNTNQKGWKSPFRKAIKHFSPLHSGPGGGKYGKKPKFQKSSEFSDIPKFDADYIQEFVSGTPLRKSNWVPLTCAFM